MSSNSVTLNPLGRWFTVKLLAQIEPAFTEAAIRNLIFNTAPRHTSRGKIPGNGLALYIRRVGSKVLIDHKGFLTWIDEQQSHVESVVQPKDSHEACDTPPAATSKSSVTGSSEASSNSFASSNQEVWPKSSKKQLGAGRT
jgi:hypothetical protein